MHDGWSFLLSSSTLLPDHFHNIYLTIICGNGMHIRMIRKKVTHRREQPFSGFCIYAKMCLSEASSLPSLSSSLFFCFFCFLTYSLLPSIASTFAAAPYNNTNNMLPVSTGEQCERVFFHILCRLCRLCRLCLPKAMLRLCSMHTPAY